MSWHKVVDAGATCRVTSTVPRKTNIILHSALETGSTMQGWCRVVITVVFQVLWKKHSANGVQQTETKVIFVNSTQLEVTVTIKGQRSMVQLVQSSHTHPNQCSNAENYNNCQHHNHDAVNVKKANGNRRWRKMDITRPAWDARHGRGWKIWRKRRTW